MFLETRSTSENIAKHIQNIIAKFGPAYVIMTGLLLWEVK